MAGMVWGQNTMVSAQQVRAMYPEVMKQSVLMTIEAVEAKARDLGIENPEVRVMFLAEFMEPADEDEPER